MQLHSCHNTQYRETLINVDYYYYCYYYYGSAALCWALAAFSVS
jgi:hypothetical protein